MRGCLLLALALPPALLLAAACAPTETKVGAARLPEADGVIPAPEGPTIELGKTPLPKTASGPVRIGADRETPYRDVVAAAHAVRAAGGTPVLLVTYRNRLYTMPDPLPYAGSDAIRLSARIDGKACVSPPDNQEATCISREDQKRIDRAFVRQVLSQAVRQYGLKHVRVEVDPALPWADAVRAIDGARTCCGAEAGVTVSVDPS